MTLKELSIATGVPQSTLSQWSANREPKKPGQIASVAKHLSVSLHYLLFGVKDDNETINLAEVLKQDLFSGTFEITIKKVQIKETGDGGK